MRKLALLIALALTIAVAANATTRNLGPPGQVTVTTGTHVNFQNNSMTAIGTTPTTATMPSPQEVAHPVIGNDDALTTTTLGTTDLLSATHFLTSTIPANSSANYSYRLDYVGTAKIVTDVGVRATAGSAGGRLEDAATDRPVHLLR